VKGLGFPNVESKPMRLSGVRVRVRVRVRVSGVQTRCWIGVKPAAWSGPTLTLTLPLTLSFSVYLFILFI
jgi:hypothetical protein